MPINRAKDTDSSGTHRTDNVTAVEDIDVTCFLSWTKQQSILAHQC